MWWCIWLHHYIDNMEHQQFGHIYYIYMVYVSTVRSSTLCSDTCEKNIFSFCFLY